jgi:8-oxo-dGTP pyrophosphatase MutT (NUDIX family)
LPLKRQARSDHAVDALLWQLGAYEFMLTDGRQHLRILAAGNWMPQRVSQDWTTNSRRIVPEVEAAIESAWTIALARPGIHLFDGPMCRLESFHAADDRLQLTLSKSNYKVFLGTNMAHPEFAAIYGPDVMANPVGISPALLTADHQLLLGQRNASVAYYPNRVHPFSGCLEPGDASLFAATIRELQEELSLAADELESIHCIGVAQDTRLIQPELMFSVKSRLRFDQIQSRLDPTEHHGIVSIPATASAIEQTLHDDIRLTPVACASLLLWGRVNLGRHWYDSQLPD